MDTLLKADIFFFVTTVAVVAVSAVFIVAIVYLIMIFRQARAIAEITRKEVEGIAADLAAFRMHVKEKSTGGFGIASALMSMFASRFRPNKKGRSRKS